MKKNNLYIDYAATTPVDIRVLKKALPYFSENFANPSSSHFMGIEVKKALAEARGKVANFLNCEPEEIIFTSGGTESENLALKGAAFSSKKFGKHILVSEIEHLSVSSSADFLQRFDFEVEKISIDNKCNLNVEQLKKSIRNDTILVSIMSVNNEIGTIQPIEQIGKILKETNKTRLENKKPPIRFHTDAEAAAFYLDCDVKKLGVDLLTINGSKLYSLKGASALFVKSGTPLATQICGGGQERYLRGGTENVPAIIALGEAVFLAKKEREKNIKKADVLKNRLVKRILGEISSGHLNTPKNSVPNIVHFTFSDNKKDLVKELSSKGIAISRGSACSAKSNSTSATLSAMGFSENEAYSSLRFSLGKNLTIKNIDSIVETLKSILKS